MSGVIVGEASFPKGGLRDRFTAIGHLPPLQRFRDPIPHGIVCIAIGFSVGETPGGIVAALFDLTSAFIVAKLGTALPPPLEIGHDLFADMPTIVIVDGHVIPDVEPIRRHHLLPRRVIPIIALETFS